MPTVNLETVHDKGFISEVERRSGQNVALCYQCGKCTAGCPYTFAYDIPVSQIMRWLQAGDRDRILECRSLWLCATCESCTTRCPNGIDVARIMDVLRHMSRQRADNKGGNVKTFWDAFLDSVRAHGRAFEMGIVASYVTRTGRFWTDVELAPKLLPRGKLSLKPHDIKGKEQIARIFKRFEESRRP